MSPDSDFACHTIQPSVPVTRPRGRVYDHIMQTVGGTPLVRINRMNAAGGADLLAKLEFFNPLASVKDRVALAMVEAAEACGELIPGYSTLVEPTSGNTGIALAGIAAVKGYRLILTMPESMSVERRKMVQLFGAEIDLTPAVKGMGGAIARARELLAAIPGAVSLRQFQNAANPQVHRQTTAEELWADTGGRVDAVVGGVGTGGTLTGVGQALRRYNPALRVIAVEPDASPVLSGGMPAPHKIQGIGAGFVPPLLDRRLIDEILTITNENAFRTARLAARQEGIPVGISSGAALCAALEVARRPEMRGKTVVVIIPSCAERYLSTPLFDGLS